MKTALVILALITTLSAAHKINSLVYGNLFRKPIAARITGGQEATPHSIPFQVFLEIYSSDKAWYCGGSLISPNYVLTAAHCGEEAIEVKVILGAHKPLSNESTQIHLESTDILIHENYYSDGVINDIGLIRLSEAVNPTDAIQIIPLPSGSRVTDNFVGSIARASGWGLTDSSGTRSTVLNYIDVEVITNEECEEVFSSIESSILCTSGHWHLFWRLGWSIGS